MDQQDDDRKMSLKAEQLEDIAGIDEPRHAVVSAETNARIRWIVCLPIPTPIANPISVFLTHLLSSSTRAFFRSYAVSMSSPTWTAEILATPKRPVPKMTSG